MVNVFAPLITQAAVFLVGVGARAAGVGASFGFGERPAAEFLALGERDDVFRFLRLGAEFVDVVGAERIVRGDDDADRAVHARQFLDDDGVFEVAHSRAAILLRENYAEETHFGELGNDFRGECRGFVPFHYVGGDFAFGEFADGAAKVLLLVGE